MSPPLLHDSDLKPESPSAAPEAGDLLVRYLEDLGVEYVFGVPGGAIEPLYDALARSARRGGPRAVVARHESGAAFMADGYFRETGKLGVCCATTGPGATNLVTGLASAYENRIPLLVITGQTALANFGRGALQESSCTGVNTVSLFQHCTRYSSLVSHPDQFEAKLVAALLCAWGSPHGPAHLSIPVNLLRDAPPVAAPTYRINAMLTPPASIDERAVTEMSRRFTRAKRPVFILGEGCAGAAGAIQELAAELGARIVATPHGKGFINPYHPLFHGVIGFAGHRTASDLLAAQDVDLLVAFGTNLGEWSTGAWDPGLLLNGRLIHVDCVHANFARSPMAQLHVLGNLELIVGRVLARMRGAFRRRSSDVVPITSRLGKLGWETSPRRRFSLDCEAKCLDASVPIKPQRLMSELAELFPPSTRYLADAGSGLAWAVHYLHPRDRRLRGRRAAHGGLFRAAMEFASMGWAIGAAIGTGLGNPGAPVVCITGDGSLLMSGQELTVAVQHRLTVVFVVLNDAALGMVKHGQRLARAEPIGFELPEADYRAYAESLGARAYAIDSAEQLRGLDIEAICAHRGPTLLDVHIDRNEVPPIGSRVHVLKG